VLTLDEIRKDRRLALGVLGVEFGRRRSEDRTVTPVSEVDVAAGQSHEMRSKFTDIPLEVRDGSARVFCASQQLGDTVYRPSRSRPRVLKANRHNGHAIPSRDNSPNSAPDLAVPRKPLTLCTMLPSRETTYCRAHSVREQIVACQSHLAIALIV
jgi:hypothetical protein